MIQKFSYGKELKIIKSMYFIVLVIAIINNFTVIIIIKRENLID